MGDTFTVLSLFSGAGGIDYGLEAAGFETVAATDFEAACCSTLKANRDWPVLEGDIHSISSSALLEPSGLRAGEVDLLVGGPPCQPFSKSGYWARGDSLRLDDPRAGTLGAYLRVLEETLPRAFLLENVEGLAYQSKSEGLELILQGLLEINQRQGTRYFPHMKVLNAAEYGVPQLRSRFIMIASRDGLPFTFPTPRFKAPDTEPGLFDGLPNYRTAWDALADVIPEKGEELSIKGKWADLLPSIPEGHNYLWHTPRGGGRPLFGWRTRFWTFLLKLAKNRPSWTIQAQPGPAIGPFHWSNRRLSLRELCRLQTFPDNMKPAGKRAAVQKQVGNAVPSLLAEVLGREIRKQFFGSALPGPPLLLPPDRSPAPAAEPVQQVSEQFLELEGEHAEHPGTGRGTRALALAGT